MNKEDLEDWLDEAISDSIDMDWTSRVGARAIIREMDAHALELVPATKPFWAWAEEFRALGFNITRYETIGEDGKYLVTRFIAGMSGLPPLDSVVTTDMTVLRLAVQPADDHSSTLQAMLEMAASAVGRAL